MAVLLLSTSKNEHTTAIEQELYRNVACDVFRLNTDVSPEDSIIIAAGEGRSNNLWLEKDGRVLQAADISGVFVHHVRIAAPPDAGWDDIDRNLHASSWKAAISWLENALPTAIWINRPSRIRESSSIAYQQQYARAEGLPVPRTIFTNSITALHHFARDCESIVAKASQLSGADIRGHRLMTHIVTPESIDSEELRSAPCLFQEYINKDHELRVHVIRGAVLACKIESQASSKTKVDWRNYDLSQTPHWPIELDSRISAQCVALVRRLGLELGIIDLIVTPSGETVFLECNAQGHWLWIEHLTRLPITNAICRALKSAAHHPQFRVTPSSEPF